MADSNKKELEEKKTEAKKTGEKAAKVKADAKAEVKAKAEEKSETKAETKAEVKAEPKAEAKAEEKIEKNTAADSDTEKNEEEIRRLKSDIQMLEQRIASMSKSKKSEMSDQLKQMLSEEIKAFKKKEKRRSVEILGVFARHNFYANGFTPVELRTTLEDLGPTYVKIGQIMSSRTDLLPVSYCRELEKLRQNVKELDPAIARAVIEQETGKRIDEIYSEFRDKPIGSASIGQVHAAVLKDGRKVVTKVQRPLIAEMMRKDFVLLKKLAGAMNIANEDEDDGEEMVDLGSVIDELEKVTEEELDFRVEANNTRFFKEKCITDEEKVTCPDVIDELTTERIFTMTFVDGYSVSKKDRMIEEGYNPEDVGYAILENYVHQILDVGTFHGDPHQGNIMFSHGKVYWIDFGMIGRVTNQDINLLQNMILSLLEYDMDGLTNAILSMGAGSSLTNRNMLMEDIDAFLSKYMSVTSAEDLDLAVLLTEITDLAARNHVSMPGKYTMLVRSIATIEGVMEQLSPEVNLFKILSDKLMDRAKKSFDVNQALTSAGKDVLKFSKKTSQIPTLTSDALNSVVKGRLKVTTEVTALQEVSNRAIDTIKYVVMALLAGMLFLGSSFLASADISPKAPGGMPLLAAVGLIFSISLAIYAVINLTKKKKE